MNIILWFFLPILVFLGVIFTGMWKMFTKTNQPGWAAIIPIYNTVVIFRMIGRPGWWVIFYFIPLANIIVFFIMSHELAKAFGKGLGYTFGLIFLPFIFYPALGYGRAKYTLPIQM